MLDPWAFRTNCTDLKRNYVVFLVNLVRSQSISSGWVCSIDLNIADMSRVKLMVKDRQDPYLHHFQWQLLLHGMDHWREEPNYCHWEWSEEMKFPDVGYPRLVPVYGMLHTSSCLCSPLHPQFSRNLRYKWGTSQGKEQMETEKIHLVNTSEKMLDQLAEGHNYNHMGIRDKKTRRF